MALSPMPIPTRPALRQAVRRCALRDAHAARHFLRTHGLKLAAVAVALLMAYVLPLRAAEIAAAHQQLDAPCAVQP